MDIDENGGYEYGKSTTSDKVSDLQLILLRIALG